MKPIELNEYCPCCGFDTYNSKTRLEYDICPICFWEDDPEQFKKPDYISGANRVSLIEGQSNFQNYGACEKDMKHNVRNPNKNDILNPEWKTYNSMMKNEK